MVYEGLRIFSVVYQEIGQTLIVSQLHNLSCFTDDNTDANKIGPKAQVRRSAQHLRRRPKLVQVALDYM